MLTPVVAEMPSRRVVPRVSQTADYVPYRRRYPAPLSADEKPRSATGALLLATAVVDRRTRKNTRFRAGRPALG